MIKKQKVKDEVQFLFHLLVGGPSVVILSVKWSFMIRMVTWWQQLLVSAKFWLAGYSLRRLPYLLISRNLKAIFLTLKSISLFSPPREKNNHCWYWKWICIGQWQSNWSPDMARYIWADRLVWKWMTSSPKHHVHVTPDIFILTCVDIN